MKLALRSRRSGRRSAVGLAVADGWLALAACAVVLASPVRGAALGGGKAPGERAYRESAHGDLVRGATRAPGERRGSCLNCHGARADGTASGTRGAKRLAANGALGNELCFECHQRSAATSFQGDAAYGSSGHALSPVMVWPGPPPRARADAGKCVNCHDPHGSKDRAGLVPAMLRVRGEMLCLTCHDGDPSKDVRTAFLRQYRHPLTAEVPGGASPAAAGGRAALVPPSGASAGIAATRTCTGCHNPHVAQPTDSSPVTAGSRPLFGVARVRVAHGSPGTVAGYTAIPADDGAPAREHEVCYRCHSGYAQRPPRLVDVAALLNPQNPSFHPVEERSRNAPIDPRAFAAGWSADRLVQCSDCHSADGDGSRGPHGSRFQHILKRRYPVAVGGMQPVQEGDLCFECHAFATYADPAAGQAATYSKFPWHVAHAVDGVSCNGCHDAHGSATLPALLVLRSPGLRSYTVGSLGTTCATTCHRKTPATVPPYRPALHAR